MLLIFENASTTLKLEEMTESEVREYVSFIATAKDLDEAKAIIKRDAKEYFDCDSIHSDLSNICFTYYVTELVATVEPNPKVVLQMKLDVEMHNG